MSYDVINNYIYNYLCMDKTNRAIMLKGDWGVGKSHYIKNDLISYLEGQRPFFKCIIISLYGIRDINDISKRIYLESRTVIDESKSEVASTAVVVGKIIGKTIFNGVVSKIGFDIGSISDEDLNKVYKSIDLSDKLIVLEDVERSKIDIIDVLGYVNNICEYDKAKVMLVTNEKSFLTMEKVKSNPDSYNYTDKAIEYIKYKEKTVGDTLNFVCEYETTIPNILKDYYVYLNKFNNQDTIIELKKLFCNRIINLRSFIYACQKTEEILRYIESRKIYIDSTTEKVLFYGIIGFVSKNVNAPYEKFASRTNISSDMGLNNEFPLFKFCYNYIRFQVFPDDDVIKKTLQSYMDYCRNASWKSGKDRDIETIRSFRIKKEKEILSSVDNIKKKIKNGTMSYYDYGILSNYLVAIKYDAGLEIDIDEIEHLMIKSLEKRDNNADPLELFSDRIDIKNKDGAMRYNILKMSLIKAMVGMNNSRISYNPVDFVKWCKNYDLIRYKNLYDKVIFRIEPTEFERMIVMCDANQLDEIRSFLHSIYVVDRRYDSSIICSLQEICKWIDNEKFDKLDKIQIYQIQMIKDMFLSEIAANKKHN